MGPRRLGLALWLSLAGCIPFPFATPPVQLEVGPEVRRVQRAVEPPLEVPLQLRLSVTPLSFRPEHLDRPLDFGAGFCLDAGRAPSRGGYLELSAIPLSRPLEGGLVRLLLRAQGRLLYDPVGERFGQGAAVQVVGELATFADGPFNTESDTGGYVGAAYGEGAVGIYFEGAYGQYADRRDWTAGGGLQLRVPASVGVGYVWVWALR